MNRRFAFLAAILGGYFIAGAALQLWSGITGGAPFNFAGTLIFTGGWLLGWVVLFGLTNLVLRRRKERMDALDTDAAPGADNEA